MSRRILSLFGLVAWLFSPFSTPAAAYPALPAGKVSAAVLDMAANSPLRVTNSDAASLTIEFQLPAYQMAVVADANQTSRGMQIIAPGATLLGDPGKPQLPVYTALIGVPPQADIQLEVVAAPAETLTGKYDFAPAPTPLQAADETSFAAQTYARDPRAYAQDALFPGTAARIASQAWVRDQRVARIEIYPFQYNPARQTLALYRQMRVIVHFVGARETVPLASQSSNSETSAFDTALQSVLINYDQARPWRGIPPQAVNLPDAPGASTVSLGPRLKIEVDHDGLYCLTYADLQTAGINVDTLDPRTFHMHNQGDDVAVFVPGEENGQFEPGEAIYFYGEKFRGDTMAPWYQLESQNWLTFTQVMSNGTSVPWRPSYSALQLEKYTSVNVYWLNVGGDAGPRMATLNGDPSGSTAVTPATFRSTVHAERQVIHNSHVFAGEETWFWEIIQNTVDHVYTTTLQNVATQPYSATVRGEVVSLAYNASVKPDHRTQVRINTRSTPIDDSYWDGASRFRFTSQIPQSNLKEGVNQLKFRIADAIGGTNMYFDWFEIEYQRLFQVSAGQLWMSVDEDGTWKYQVSGFLSNTVGIYNISNPRLPVRVLNPSLTSAGTYTATFVATDIAGSDYYLADASAVQSPKSIRYYVPPDLKSFTNQADYLIIAAPSLITATQALADYRSSQGLQVKVVSLEDVYNEFGEGIYHSQAIKTFLAYTFAHWQTPAPTYALLVGNGHWNMQAFKNGSTYVTTPVAMPPHLSWTDPWQGELDSVNLLGAVVGTDPISDLMIARIPVDTPAQFTIIYNKIVQYEQQESQPWQRRMAFVADNTPDEAGDFAAFSEGVMSTYVKNGYQADRLFLDDYCGSPKPGNPPCPTMTTAITSTVNTTGTLILNYVGHGGLGWWAHEGIMQTAHVAKLKNVNQLFVLVSMTCHDGVWMDAKTPRLSAVGLAMLRLEGGGAVGAFLPSGMGSTSGHDVLHHGFYDSLMNQGDWRLGAAAMNGIVQLYGEGHDPELVVNFYVAGDPALQIHSSHRLAVTPAVADQSGQAGTMLAYSLQITNTGMLTDTFTLVASDNAWTTTLPASIGPLVSGQSQTVTVNVQIPPGASQGASDMANITVTSRKDLSQRKVIRLTSMVLNAYQVYLPLTRR